MGDPRATKLPPVRHAGIFAPHGWRADTPFQQAPWRLRSPLRSPRCGLSASVRARSSSRTGLCGRHRAALRAPVPAMPESRMPHTARSRRRKAGVHPLPLPTPVRYAGIPGSRRSSLRNTATTSKPALRKIRRPRKPRRHYTQQPGGYSSPEATFCDKPQRRFRAASWGGNPWRAPGWAPFDRWRVGSGRSPSRGSST